MGYADMVKKGQLLDIEISDIAFGGKGFARIGGFVVFADQTVPMDHVTVRIVKKKKNYAEALLVKIISPSPFRTTPPCIYHGFCGGCKWQFLTYERQLFYKRRHVSDSVEHIGLIKDVPVHPVLASDSEFHYRNKMEFSCSDSRWLLPDEMNGNEAEKGFALGLHVPETFYKVLDTEKCLLQPELGNRILDDVRKFIKNSKAPVYGLRSHTGFWRFLMLRHSVAYDQWMVNIITATENREAVQPLADLLREKYPEIVSLVNNIAPSRASVAVGAYEILLSGLSHLKDKIGKFEFEISANSFFQTNTRGAERLYETVKKFARLTGSEVVADLYSGTGTIPVFLSDSAKEVIGMEIVSSAVADAERNCRLNGLSNCRFILGDIKDCLSQSSISPDVMIIDPPRVGMHKDVVRQVLDISPQRIVYVSCNPATLARDLGMMKDRYHIAEIQPADLFPHTFHIESVARLEKKTRG